MLVVPGTLTDSEISQRTDGCVVSGDSRLVVKSSCGVATLDPGRVDPPSGSVTKAMRAMSIEKSVSDEPTISLAWAMLLLVPIAACTLGIAVAGLWLLYGSTGIPADAQMVVIPTFVMINLLAAHVWRWLLIRFPNSPWSGNRQA